MRFGGWVTRWIAVLTVMAAVVVQLPAAALPVAAASSGSIEGQLFGHDRTEGEPGVGVDLLVRGTATVVGSAVSDAEGFYRFSSVAAGEYAVRVNASPPRYVAPLLLPGRAGYIDPAAASAIVVAAGPVVLPAVEFHLWPGQAWITGHVDDPLGRPVSVGIAARAQGTASDGTGSGDDGYFQLGPLPAGEWTLTATPPTHVANLARTSVGPLSVAAGEARLGSDITLRHTAVVSGVVTRQTLTGDEPASAVDVTITDSAHQTVVVTTDASGRYRVRLQPDVYAFRFVGAGPDWIEPTWLGPGDSARVMVVAGVDIPNANARFRRGATVRGRIADAAGRPIANAAVRATDRNGVVVWSRDAGDGRYELVGLRPGPVRLRAEGALHIQVERDVDLMLGNDLDDVAFVLDRDPTAVAPDGEIYGVVTDADTGAPVAGLAVVATVPPPAPTANEAGTPAASGGVPGQALSVTDQLGRYRIGGLDRHVHYWLIGLENEDQYIAQSDLGADFVLADGEPARNVDGVVSRSGLVVGSVQVAPASAATQVEVCLASGRCTSPDANGAFRFGLLPPGPQTISILHLPIERSFTVIPGRTTRVDLDLGLVSELSMRDASVVEGNPGDSVVARIPVVLSRAVAEPVLVTAYIQQGSAAWGRDYEGDARGYAVTIPVGRTRADVVIPILADRWQEDDETIGFRLATYQVRGPVVVGRDVGASLTILDDDGENPPPPLPDLTVDDIVVTETNGGQLATLTATLTAASTEVVTATWSTLDGTANGNDYIAAAGVLAFAPGRTSTTFTVSIKGDTTQEPTESFLIDVADVAGAREPKAPATVTILDDDLPATLSAKDVRVAEGRRDHRVTIKVKLPQPALNDIKIKWRTADGTARARSDYRADSGSVTIRRGKTSATITITIIGDRRREKTEQFTIAFAPRAGAQAPARPTVVTIVDDD